MDNKRIALNTIYLYIRMAITLMISLYMSRVVLSSLGVVDFGLYNVVGGVVVMFSFITAPMTSTIQRYVTVALGKNDFESLKEIIAVSFRVLFVLSLIILVLSESLGLWFVANKLVVPADRVYASHVVYQISILTAILSLLSQPLDGMVIAYEKMSYYAIISIVSSILRLVVAILISYADTDRLILYSILLLGIQSLISISTYIYCNAKLFQIKIRKVNPNKDLLHEMMGFAGLNLFGGISYVLNTQGINILLNLYFGPAVNAARGLAVQVQNATKIFSESFQNALNPQITKSYSVNDFNRTFSLMLYSSKFSIILLSFIATPVILEAEAILKIWLSNPPEHTINFIRITLLTVFINVIGTPLTICSLATGDIKRYQIIIGIITMLAIPACWLYLNVSTFPEGVFIILLISSFITLITQLILLNKQIGLPLSIYLLGIGRTAIALLVTALAVNIIRANIGHSLFNIIEICIINFLITLVMTYFIALNKIEKEYIITIIHNRIKKINL